MMPLSIILTYYDQPKMLERQVEEMRRYPNEAKEQLDLVIVDDCSKEPLKRDQIGGLGFPFRAFRVLDDIPWNQHGARNLGVLHVKSEWMYLLDLDHLIPKKYISYIMSFPKKRKTIYKQKRKVVFTWEDIVLPYNVYMIHKSDFLASCGNDEGFAGHKGWTDVLQFHHYSALGYKVEVMKGYTLSYSKNDIWGEKTPPAIIDASTRGLDREIKTNEKRYRERMDWINKVGWDEYARSKRMIRFSWEEVT